MALNKQEKGKLGEDIAVMHLEKNGFKILERNFKAKNGEADIVAEKKRELYFVEVKTRWSVNYGDPLESVTYSKQRQVINAAKYYIAKKRAFDVNCHLSAIGVDMSGDMPAVEFIEDAFEII